MRQPDGIHRDDSAISNRAGWPGASGVDVASSSLRRLTAAKPAWAAAVK
jgi:hypothetical protein